MVIKCSFLINVVYARSTHRLTLCSCASLTQSACQLRIGTIGAVTSPRFAKWTFFLFIMTPWSGVDKRPHLAYRGSRDLLAVVSPPPSGNLFPLNTAAQFTRSRCIEVVQGRARMIVAAFSDLPVAVEIYSASSRYTSAQIQGIVNGGCLLALRSFDLLQLLPVKL